MLTDHKEIMKRIEEILPGIYTFMSELHPTIQTSTPKVGGAVTNDSVIQRPIAKLDEILPGSPAAEGGVQEGDMLLSFGTVNANIPSPLNGIPEVVRQNVNQPINLVVLRRGTEIVTLQMTPKTWAGRGLLGCHLTPI